MKKKLFLYFFGFVCSAFLMAQSLDEAILAAAVKISRDLPANTKVALINFSSPSGNITNYVVDGFNGNLLRNRRIKSVNPDQGQLQRIRGELSFRTDGTVSAESAQSIGQLLEVEHLITGSLERDGAVYRLLFTAVDAERGELQSRYTASLNLRNDQQLALLLGEGLQSVTQNSREGASGNNRTDQQDSRFAEPADQGTPFKFFAGGYFSYQDRKTKFPDPDIKENFTVKNTSVGFSPLLGYRFGKGTVGISFLYEKSSYLYEHSSLLSSSQDETSLTTWGIGIFGDYNFFSINGFSIIGRVNFQYNSSDSIDSPIYIIDVPSRLRPDQLKTISVDIVPIFEYKVFDHFALNASIGGIYFDHTWVDSKIIENNFGISIPSGIRLSDLRLGFTFFF